MFEVYTGEQPFKAYERASDDSDEWRRPLTDTLGKYMKQYKSNKFLTWLLEWVAYPRVNDGNHVEMLGKLKEWKNNGICLTRKVPTKLFEK